MIIKIISNVMGNKNTKMHYIANNDSAFIGSLSASGNGYGKIIFRDSSIYIGNIYENLLHGYGTCQYANGVIYEGNWKNGVRDGAGKLYLVGGEIYDGNFEIDEINGRGTYIYKDGTYYVGDFKFGKRVGIGILYNNVGCILYSGEWCNDKYCVKSRRNTKVSPFSSPDMNPAISETFTIPTLDLTIPTLDLDKLKQPKIKHEFAQVVINQDVAHMPIRRAGTINPMFFMGDLNNTYKPL